MQYQVYGNYGYLGENLLFESNSLDHAIRWATRYVRWGDFGGYSLIDVANFTEDGEFISHWSRSEEEAY